MEDTHTIVYRPSTIGDDYRYDFSVWNGFDEDPVAGMTLLDLPALVQSPHWEDRVRAEYLRHRRKITLPDGFPCLYESIDSPNKAWDRDPSPTVWVASSDEDMLQALLPEYQEMWDKYTSQWGPMARRVLVVGRLDGVSARGVYRPGTTVDEVLIATARMHSFGLPARLVARG